MRHQGEVQCKRGGSCCAVRRGALAQRHPPATSSLGPCNIVAGERAWPDLGVEAKWLAGLLVFRAASLRRRQRAGADKLPKHRESQSRSARVAPTSAAEVTPVAKSDAAMDMHGTLERRNATTTLKSCSSRSFSAEPTMLDVGFPTVTISIKTYRMF
eukprot:scaffold1954_cov268-Pinguiococcus_pyrenoidosus.AAC.64